MKHITAQRFVDFLRPILDWLAPSLCILCQQPTSHPSHCCQECYPNLPFQTLSCSRCGQMLGAECDFCGHCIQTPPSFDRCFCTFAYEDPIAEIVQQFKYAEKPKLAVPLANLLAQEILDNEIALPDLLIPVPMHLSKLRSRGYNQSLLLTRQLSLLLSIPYRTDIIVKVKRTPAQATMSLKQRKRNLRGSFAAERTIDLKKVAIVDDVFTTGSTAEEIAKILKRIGVDYVQIWGVAHTQ